MVGIVLLTLIGNDFFFVGLVPFFFVHVGIAGVAELELNFIRDFLAVVTPDCGRFCLAFMALDEVYLKEENT